MGALTCLESRLGIIHTVLLHRPSVVGAEVEEVPEFGVPTTGLQDVSVVDVRIGLHSSDHILQPLEVLLNLVGPDPVVDCVAIFLLLRRSNKAVEQHDVQGNLLLAIDLLKAPFDSCDGVKAHSSTAIDVNATVDDLRNEQSWETG